jgi:hypothetical protein
MKTLAQTLEQEAPNAWKDFSGYASRFNTYLSLSSNNFSLLPFEMQLGIYLSYLQENNVEIDLINPEMSVLENSIKEAFIGFEKVIGHYS